MAPENTDERQVSRRRLVGIATAGALGTAGCVGFLGDDDGEDDRDEPEDGGDDTTDDSASEDAWVDDDSDDGDDATAGDTEAGPQLGDQPLFPDAFAIEGTLSATEFDEPTPFAGRVDAEGNVYIAVDGPRNLEWYVVEDRSYSVVDDDGQRRCFRGDESDGLPEADPRVFETEATENADLGPADTETVDGEQRNLYEISGENAVEHDGPIELAVSDETGYLRRVETPDSVWEFHSSGGVEPVEAPEMDCSALS